MYFVPKEFSPRYGPDFFTFTFVPFALDGTQLRTPVGQEESADLTPPGQTSMWCWVADTLGFDCCDAGSPYIEHKIEVRCGRNTFTLFKRYSEFISLITQLKDAIPTETTIDAFDLLPAKTYLGHNFDDVFLKNRHNQLATFLEKLCLELCEKNLIRTNNIVQTWFNVMPRKAST